MNNSVLDNYKGWLKNYCNRINVSEKEKNLAKQVIKDFNEVKTLAQAKILLDAIAAKEHIPESNLVKFTSLFFRKKDNQSDVAKFYNNIKIWQKDAAERLRKFDIVFKKVSELVPRVEVNSLVILLQNLMANKESLLLNENGGSLLGTLELSDLQKNLDYLADLSEQVTASNTSFATSMIKASNQSSFLSEQPIDAIHADCQRLIRKMAANSDPSNKVWEQSNSLLQTAIAIYTDIKTSLNLAPAALKV